MTADLLLLGGLWMLWCAGHSLLAATGGKEWLRRRWSVRPACYRLGYNLWALLSLLPILWWERHLGGAAVLSWSGPPVALQWLLWIIAGWLAWAGGRVYPLDEFLGLDCWRTTVAAEPGLRTDGVLALVRHPWYLAGLLVLWARNLTLPELTTATILSGYLLLGACLEERRLSRRFGLAYQEYRRRTPMLIPWRWLLARLKDGRV